MAQPSPQEYSSYVQIRVPPDSTPIPGEALREMMVKVLTGSPYGRAEWASATSYEDSTTTTVFLRSPTYFYTADVGGWELLWM